MPAGLGCHGPLQAPPPPTHLLTPPPMHPPNHPNADSSEAMLSGRKPPFRLLVRAVHTRGQPISVRHAVSEGFVVATRRTRTAGKVGEGTCVSCLG